MRKIYLLVILSLCVSAAIHAQFDINAVSTNYTEDFNALTNGTWTDGTTVTGWYAKTDNTATIATYGANTGTTTAGGLYAYGVAGTNPLSERALGFVSSNAFTGGSGTGKGYIGWRLRNNTGSAISSITVTWTGEQWRKENNAAAHSLSLYYQTGTTVTNLTAGTWTAAPSTFTSPITGATAAAALDGNAGANRVAGISVTITVAIAAGDEIMLRWEDLNDAGNDHFMAIDDVTINAAPGITNTITTTTVSSPPFSLANCAATASGTVDFTSTDVFNGPNVFTAQLSNDIGSFSSPVSIGTLALSGNGPSGTINIIIPAGTVSGTGYRIRVVASDPVVTGSVSAPFTIVQLGACASSHTDYYRSVATGNWDAPATWESSQDNITWIAATLAPTSLANTITIRSPDVVTVATAASADQVTVQSGATLSHSAGVFTIEDGTGDDINILNGGIFLLASNGISPTFAVATATINNNTGGIVRVSGTGLTGAGVGVNANNYVYQHQSILEYTLTSAFSTGNVTYFPNAGAGVIPIFRASNAGAITVGAGTPTTFNGIFESNGGGVSWQSAGVKTFRNGITGSGAMTATATSGLWSINGATAELGGSGIITAPSSFSLDIGTGTAVTMSSAKTIIGTTNLLANSYITLGNFDLSINGSIVGGTTNYVRTNGTGSLVLVNVTALRNAPIGNSTYNPLTVTHADGINWSLRVEDVLTVVDPTFLANVIGAVQREWHITPSTNPPATGADIVFQWDDSDPAQVGTSYLSTQNVQVWHEVPSGMPWGADWIAAGVAQTATGAPGPGIRTASITGWTWFSPFAVSNINFPLPLKLITFNAVKINSSMANLSWELAGVALPGASFEVEKSADGRSFTS
ncbi:MAG: hypothetical protein JNM19_01980, partial [Chitinophagaceae bacterium]|nr:hypothetical protein [Chitinophagaceae bacterium]